MRRMTGLTFTRLSARGEPRDVARIFVETERARDAEEILMKAMKNIVEIMRLRPVRGLRVHEAHPARLRDGALDIV